MGFGLRKPVRTDRLSVYIDRLSVYIDSPSVYSFASPNCLSKVPLEMILLSRVNQGESFPLLTPQVMGKERVLIGQEWWWSWRRPKDLRQGRR